MNISQDGVREHLTGRTGTVVNVEILRSDVLDPLKFSIVRDVLQNTDKVEFIEAFYSDNYRQILRQRR